MKVHNQVGSQGCLVPDETRNPRCYAPVLASGVRDGEVGTIMRRDVPHELHRQRVRYREGDDRALELGGVQLVPSYVVNYSRSRQLSRMRCTAQHDFGTILRTIHDYYW